MAKSSRIKGKDTNPDKLFSELEKPVPIVLKEKTLNISKSSNSNPESLTSWGEKKRTKQNQ